MASIDLNSPEALAAVAEARARNQAELEADRAAVRAWEAERDAALLAACAELGTDAPRELIRLLIQRPSEAARDAVSRLARYL
jgi:hypothetical protein